MAEIMPCLPRNSKPFFLIDTMKLKIKNNYTLVM